MPAFPGGPLGRLCCRALVALAQRLLLESSGWEHVAAANDPFIFAANHSQKLEAVLLPALLAFQRRGRQVHFFADWNYFLYPGLGWLMRINDPIVVVRKPARPAILNVLQPFFRTSESPMAAAYRRLLAGQSIGVFPEGTRNGSPAQLLRGLRGAARLSLKTGAPVVPVGVRFPHGTNAELARFSIQIGAPMRPAGVATTEAGWHAQIMRAIATLSGKTWHPDNPRTNHETRH
jgi:1-acyl-sn-glycerol-3-phosphate acyltransferase